MDPNVWGKSTWATIHYIALAYPEFPTLEDKQKYKAFYLALGPVLPCHKCSVNYQRHLQELPIDAHLASKASLFEWTVQLHNIVNRENNKPTWTTQEAFHYYVHNVKPEVKFNYNNLYIPLVILVIVACFFIAKRKGI